MPSFSLSPSISPALLPARHLSRRSKRQLPFRLVATATWLAAARLGNHRHGRRTMAAAALSSPCPRRPSQPTRRIVWHRAKDLRFHDHPFHDPMHSAPATTSVFVFDDVAAGCGPVPSACRPNDWRAVRIGPHGTRILLESVRDLRRNSRERVDRGLLSQELVVRRGPTVPVLVELMNELIESDLRAKRAIGETALPGVRYEVCWNEEPGWYEARLSREVETALTDAFGSGSDDVEVTIRTDCSCTLYHPDDLPLPGEWQPLSKKEKRRRQSQQRRQQKRVQMNTQSPRNSDQRLHYNSSHGSSTIDVSSARWAGMPRIMGDFRRIAREKTRIRPSLDRNTLADTTMNTDIPPGPNPTDAIPRIDPGRMPTLEELLEPLLSYVDETRDGSSATEMQPILGLPASVIRKVCQNSLRIHHQNLKHERDDDGKRRDHCYAAIGGETAGSAHLETFCRRHLHAARRSLACVDDHESSRLSHSLAFGCLSPRTVVRRAEAAVKEYEKNEKETKNDENDGTWLVSHMTMRDFFLFTCLASGERFYGLDGIPVSQKAADSTDWRAFDSNETHKLWTAWATGATGLPLVDAAMTELVETGYCSNRVRQNAASVLTKDLRVDWRAGAEWFQFLLVDHCVGANWGNWLYFSGVGPDPKQRHFRTVSQALRYDPHGSYVRKWLPELRRAVGSDEESHLRPWDFDPSRRSLLVVDPESQYTWRDHQRLRETGRLSENHLIS